MFKPYILLLSLFLALTTLLSGCATSPVNSSPSQKNRLTGELRATTLLKNKRWKLQGKIAFIQKTANKKKDKRESATISWQVNHEQNTQELNLTSYLGINVLHLKSKDTHHQLKVDGKEYHTRDLSLLIYNLTGLTLPIEALSFWLKGIAYQANDKIELNPATQLPVSLTSAYNNTFWKINYSHYQNFNGVNMATKFIIKKNGLIIKVAVNKWSLAV